MDLPEPLNPADEYRHSPDPDDPLWNESWYLDWALPDASLGGYVRWSVYPNLGASWFWACLVGEDRPLVIAVDNRLPDPADPEAMGLQIEGLRAQFSVNGDFESFSVRFESSAAKHDDPATVFTDSAGDPATLAFDLTWETEGGVYPYPGVSRYEIPCRVHGSVWVGDEGHRIDTPGERDHSWGHRDWWSFGWVWTSGALDDGTAFHATTVRIPGVDYTPGFVRRPGLPLEGIDGFAAEEVTDADGLPTGATMGLHDLSLGVTPVAHAPVRLDAPDGRSGRLQRALCRFTSSDGRQGTGWTEWNQPPP